jgi:mannose-6-phosphate isomerase-like protein (cupin superfamily)
MTVNLRRSQQQLIVSLVLALCGACGARDAEAVPRDDSGGAPGAASPASGQGVELYPAAQLNHVGDSLARTGRTGHMLGSHDSYQYLQIRRASSGVPEVHDRWIDVAIVQAGRGTLLSGGRVAGSHVESPGEHRGGSIVGGTARPVAAGDLMIIPAGIPHQYQIATGDSLRYLTTKVLEPAAKQRREDSSLARPR